MQQQGRSSLPGIYCNSLNSYSRFITRVVNIGSIPLGGKNPIRIQSMTTTDTMDTIGTVEQSIRMAEAGCEYVRITAPSIKEAQNLAEIKKELKKRGYEIPLIADIHFTPNAAELAARLVEKVRVNPGNYADKKKFETIDYSDEAYNNEVERIYKRFAPLVKVCKEYGTAMRIGTNHGSLSDRILSRYGDTPLGMVESAMEFMRICEDLHYYNMVISMKASNPQVMVQAYRLLVKTMQEEGMNYPLHLGVTEAGDGEDGRIKSAVGIGTLLEDGLGDTIRVSLTEDPEFEAPVAIALAKKYDSIPAPEAENKLFSIPASFSPFAYSKRHSKVVHHIGGNHVPVVISDLSTENLKDPMMLSGIGYNYSPILDKYNLTEMSADFAYLGNTLPSFHFPGNLKIIYDHKTWISSKEKESSFPLFSMEEYVQATEKSALLNFIRMDVSTIDIDKVFTLADDLTVVLILSSSSNELICHTRTIFFEFEKRNLKIPVIIQRNYQQVQTELDFQLYASTDMGSLLLDGFGDGIWINASPSISKKVINSTAFGVLQATRTRISKTEYISCPSCGRTLFNLQETTQLIRSRTDHLKGIKIGIMGCIVNGPGEMADADYGYVGTGPGKITLYRGKEVVRKNVNSENAVEELIELIKEDDKWLEPPLIEHLS